MNDAGRREQLLSIDDLESPAQMPADFERATATEFESEAAPVAPSSHRLDPLEAAGIDIDEPARVAPSAAGAALAREPGTGTAALAKKGKLKYVLAAVGLAVAYTLFSPSKTPAPAAEPVASAPQSASPTRPESPQESMGGGEGGIDLKQPPAPERAPEAAEIGIDLARTMGESPQSQAALVSEIAESNTALAAVDQNCSSNAVKPEMRPLCVRTGDATFFRCTGPAGARWNTALAGCQLF